MCRLFAQISPLPLSAEPYLVDSDFSLLKQSNFNKKNLQKDGWGIANYGNKNKPVVSKSPKPVFLEAMKFKKAAAARSTAIIGHIRAASNPRDLPKNKLLNLESAQPFTDGRWIFAHNGTLEIPDEVTKALGPLRRNIKSSNDSEVYFWQFIKFYRKTGDATKALKACIGEIWDLWKKCKSRYPQKKGPYTSLNALLSDGQSLYALCHFFRKGLADCGVCNPSQPWSVMSFARRGPLFIAASEDLDKGSWTRFDPPEILCVRIEAEKLKIKRTHFTVEVIS